MNLHKRFVSIRKNLPSEVKLIAVTKNVDVRIINQAAFLGVTDIGESRVSSALKKKLSANKNLKWHMIGHLQSNKVKDAVEIFDMIQTVDSFKLAKKIDSVAASKNKVMAVLVQVNISNDPKKYGLNENEIFPFLKSLSSLKNLKVLGLMTIILDVSEEDAKPYFSKMKTLFDNIKLFNIPNIDMKYLSMGMSRDFRVAIESGSNMVRIGTSLFKD